MTEPAQPDASPLCRVRRVYYLRHELDLRGVCVRCGWAVPGRKDAAEFERARGSKPPFKDGVSANTTNSVGMARSTPSVEL